MSSSQAFCSLVKIVDIDGVNLKVDGANHVK